jgi:hypothetical protein
MDVPRVVNSDPRDYGGVEMGEMGELFLVEGQIGAAAKLSLEDIQSITIAWRLATDIAGP